MHRAIGRVIRGQCRKFRENDCPVASGEEVRHKNKEEDNKNGFCPPKHCFEEAVTWTTVTTGFVLGYQLNHRRRRALIEECPPATTASVASKSLSSCEAKSKVLCPFGFASRVFSQPFSSPSTVLNVAARKASTTSAVISSIDVTPFIHDDAQDSELPDRTPTAVEDDDDDIVFAFESETKSLSGEGNRISDNPAEYGIKFGADLLNVLGAFEFLQAEAKSTSSATRPSTSQSSKKTARNSKKSKSRTSSSVSDFSSKNPPVHAMELMKRGAELGSARAIYNIGVAYERLNDPQLAKEYYKRAADLGHPLATYNCAVFALKDGHLAEGYALMKTASDSGVPEAVEFLKPSENSLALQIQVGKV